MGDHPLGRSAVGWQARYTLAPVVQTIAAPARDRAPDLRSAAALAQARRRRP